MEPLISIIIPIYNAEKYIERCIESIQKQTYSNLDIILVNDGSTDSSALICDKYANTDKRIQVIHKENKGAYEARNTGLKLAKGEYIAFVDSDDHIHPDMISSLYQAIIREKTICSMCKGLRAYNDTVIEKPDNNTTTILNQEEIIKRLFSGDSDYVQYAVVWNKLIKKEIIDNILFNNMLRW